MNSLTAQFGSDVRSSKKHWISVNGVNWDYLNGMSGILDWAKCLFASKSGLSISDTYAWATNASVSRWTSQEATLFGFQSISRYGHGNRQAIVAMRQLFWCEHCFPGFFLSFHHGSLALGHGIILEFPALSTHGKWPELRPKQMIIVTTQCHSKFTYI